MLTPLPSAAAMRAADAAMEAAGLPAVALMETAGRLAGRWLARHAAARASEARPVLVLAGRGGNGGDGLVAARVLAERGVPVVVALAHAPDALRADAAVHFGLLRTLFPDVPVRHPGEALPPAASVLVEALLGTGQTGAVRAPERALLDAAPAADLRVALDVPAGVDADTGAAADDAFGADHTLAFAAAKPGLYLGAGAWLAGRVHVLDIGIPRALLAAQTDAHGGAYRTSEAWRRAVQPRRTPPTHKYAAGSVLVVAGSPAYLGAPRLAATAAARAGAGYVRLATGADAAALALALPDVPVTAIPTLPSGALDPDALLGALGAILPRTGALVVGPGLGRAPETLAAVRALLKAFDGPAVVDADALAALDADFLRDHARGRWILTPHDGELARLLGSDDAPDLSDPVAAARALADRWNAVVVRKGLPSLAAAPGGPVVLGAPHDVALATAGTGDVLAGVAGGFLAQGAAPLDAALLALHGGGRAAQAWSARRAPVAMQASDLLDLLPRALA